MSALSAWVESLRGGSGWSRRISKRAFILVQIAFTIPLSLAVSGMMTVAFHALAGWDSSMFTWLFSGIVIPLCLGAGSAFRWEQDQTQVDEGNRA